MISWYDIESKWNLLSGRMEEQQETWEALWLEGQQNTYTWRVLGLGAVYR